MGDGKRITAKNHARNGVPANAPMNDTTSTPRCANSGSPYFQLNTGNMSARALELNDVDTVSGRAWMRVEAFSFALSWNA